MRLLSSPAEISAAFIELARSHRSLSFAVAWATVGFDAYRVLVRHRAKITKGIVGTHFHQTHPDFIRKFMETSTVRFVLEADEVFHPKVYLFENGDRWACLVGSANFTGGGFARNHEVVVLLTEADDPEGNTHAQLRQCIDDYWAIARTVQTDELVKYEEVWRRHQQFLSRASGRYGADTVLRPIETIAILRLTWDEYLDRVRTKGSKTLEERIRVLAAARMLFVRHGHYSGMTDIERRAVAGISQPDGMQWKLFGSMQGAIYFKSRISANSPKISKALDRIPVVGPVSRTDYLQYIASFRTAFGAKGREKGDGISTATRLLAMKRPDYFVCFDQANERGLQAAFNFQFFGRKDYTSYWDDVIERILDSTWWNSIRPSAGADVDIWDGRTASSTASTTIRNSGDMHLAA